MTGIGTIDDPYIITTRAELESIGTAMAAHYALGNDIDLSGSDWTPIGFDTTWCPNEFTGSLDGRLHQIVGMTMHPTDVWEEVGGLIGWISGDVKDLSVCDVAIHMPATLHNVDGVGFLCAETGNANILNVTCSGTVYLDGSAASGVGNIGAVAGYNWGNASFTLCHADLVLVVHDVAGAWWNVGGVVGYTAYGTVATIVDCVASVTASTDANGDVTDLTVVGGIVGYMRSGTTLMRCRSAVSLKGDVNGSPATSSFGGLVGRINSYNDGNCVIRDSSSHGTLSCTSNAGGLVGYVYHHSADADVPVITIERCSADVDIHVGQYGGGAIGLRDGNQVTAFITDCYALGLVHCHEPLATPSDCIGGFVGSDLGGSVYTNCYAAGEVTGEVGGTEVGGFAGEVWA